jgi:DNA polymerase III gamma/tau subunit
MLEKVLSFSKDKKISREEVEMVTGAPRGVLVSDFVSAAIKGEVDKALKALREAIKSGSDPKIFLTLSLEKIRHALLFKIAPDVAHDVTQGFSEDEVKELNSLSKEAGLNSELLKTLLVSYDSIGRSYDAALPIELALVNIAK